VTARPTLLLEDGHVLHEALRAQRMTESELRQAVRASGSGDLSSVAAAALKTDGSVSVIPAAQAGNRSALGDVARPAHDDPGDDRPPAEEVLGAAGRPETGRGSSRSGVHDPPPTSGRAAARHRSGPPAARRPLGHDVQLLPAVRVVMRSLPGRHGITEGGRRRR
jgi:Protein of unknown function (DUF421)